MINKYCRLYNSDLAASVTRRGREYIAMCGLTTEATLYGYFPKKYEALVYTIEEIKKEDNPFYNILHDNLIPKIKKEINESDEYSEIEDLLSDKVLEHIGITGDYYMYEAITRRVKELSIKDLVKIYYKNNLKAFLNLPEVKELFRYIIKVMNDNKAIAAKVVDVEDGKAIVDEIDKDIVFNEDDNGNVKVNQDKKYSLSEITDLNDSELKLVNIDNIEGNKIEFENYNVSENDIGKHIIDSSSVFIDPYSPPEDIEENINNLSRMVEKILYGHYWYSGDYIERKDMLTNNQQETMQNIDRLAILLIDTDS